MTEPLPLAIDTNRASIARLYNFYLGGPHNFDIDRLVGNQVIERCPFIRDIAADNRRFHRRAVKHLLEEGIRQFVDIGCGIPAWENTHEIVREVDMDACVVYSDISPEARVANRKVAAGDGRIAVIGGDFRVPTSVLDHPETRDLVDFDQPVGVLGISLLPFILDSEGPGELVAEYMSRVAAGSYLALSHACIDQSPTGVRKQVEGIADIYISNGLAATLRPLSTFTEYFHGLDVVEDITFACDWRPEVHLPSKYLARTCNYAGVGQKPH